MAGEPPSRCEGPIEFPMKTAARAAIHALIRVTAVADATDLMRTTSWRLIVVGCNQKALIAVATAISPPLTRSGARS